MFVIQINHFSWKEIFSDNKIDFFFMCHKKINIKDKPILCFINNTYDRIESIGMHLIKKKENMHHENMYTTRPRKHILLLLFYIGNFANNGLMYYRFLSNQKCWIQFLDKNGNEMFVQRNNSDGIIDTVCI